MINNDLSLEIFPNGVRLYQSENLYKFTKDAIELAKFAKIKKTDRVLDMCAGVGVVGLYAYSLVEFEKLYFVEIQNSLADILNENIKLNNLTEKAKCFNFDLKELSVNNFDKKLDVIICNPPYFKVEKKSELAKGVKFEDIEDVKNFKEIEKFSIPAKELSNLTARHELFINLEEIARKVGELLKPSGKFYLIGVPTRMCEMIITLSKFGFECKRIKINTNEKNETNLILIEAVLNAKSGVKIEIN